jgi:hypothetical protein
MLTKFTRWAIAPAAAMILAGCGDKPALTIQYYPLLQASFPTVEPGGTIYFRDANGNGFTPTFKLPSPCAKIEDGKCLVDLNARHTLYPYTCPNCGDPDFGVGSDIQNSELGKIPGKVTAIPPALVQFGCSSEKPVQIVLGDPLSVSAASPGSIVWLLAGNGGDPNWTVNDFKDGTSPTTICNSDTFNQKSSECTLDPAKLAAGHTYTYQVAANQCKGTTRGTIKAQ